MYDLPFHSQILHHQQNLDLILWMSEFISGTFVYDKTFTNTEGIHSKEFTNDASGADADEYTAEEQLAPIESNAMQANAESTCAEALAQDKVQEIADHATAAADSVTDIGEMPIATNGCKKTDKESAQEVRRPRHSTSACRTSKRTKRTLTSHCCRRASDGSTMRIKCARTGYGADRELQHNQ